MSSIEELLNRRKILITCGTGGVGKTTISASLGMKAAQLGRKSIVITIDPAKRLATSLGIQLEDRKPSNLTQRLNQTLDRELQGSFFALMPDTRHSFQSLVQSLTNDSSFLSRVENNPIYDILATEYSGANEYMAMHVLEAIYREEDFDTIILDTPPSRNTLTFLNAPSLLARFFDESLIKFFLLPTQRVLSGGMKKAFSVLESLTGSGFVSNLVDFFTLLSEVQAPFAEKIKKLSTIMASDEVGFMMVTGPYPDALPDLNHLIREIDQKGFNFDALIVNRSFSQIDCGDALEPPDNDDALAQGYRIMQSLQRRETGVLQEIENLEASKKDSFLSLRLPELNRDIHSVEDLNHVAKLL